MMNDKQEDIAVDTLKDILEDYPNGHTSDAEAYIREILDEIKCLNGEQYNVLKIKALTRVRQVKEDMKNGKFKESIYPSRYQNQPLDQKINYLNSNDAPECLSCKIDLKLVKSGKQWRCPRCKSVIWLTSEQKEFLQV